MKTMKIILLKIIPLLCSWGLSAMPAERDSVTEIAEPTPYPDLQKSYVDIKNVSPEVSIILQDNNISIDSIRLKQQELQNRTRYNTPATTFPTPTAPKDIEEVAMLNSIKNSLERTLRKSEDGEGQLNAEFDYSMAAVCQIPSIFGIEDWFDGNSWNILFKPNFKQYNVKSVTLRVFKINPKVTRSSSECDEVSDFYKVTVNLYYKKKGEQIKKRMIFAKMIPTNFVGWIEIDALPTVKAWEIGRNNLGLGIDIYDQDENELHAKQHFHLQDCKAGTPIPWRGLGFLAKTAGSQNAADVLEIYRNVYTGPRLDIISSTPANYLVDSDNRKRRHAHNNRHRHHYHSSKDNYELSDSRRDHSLRSRSSDEETQ